MRIHELLAGHPLLEIDQDDNPGLGSNIPLATMASPGARAAVSHGVGAAPVDHEFVLSRLKPLRRLRSLRRGGLAASDSAHP
jgi:hypothetical protein